MLSGSVVKLVYISRARYSIGVGTGGQGGQGPPNILAQDVINIHTCSVDRCLYIVGCMLHARGGCIDVHYSLGFVKSTSSIGFVGAESNAPVYSNAGEPTRRCTSGRG